MLISCMDMYAFDAVHVWKGFIEFGTIEWIETDIRVYLHLQPKHKGYFR